MDRLWRSNSFVSSRTGCPLDIVNEEDHTVEDNEFPDFQKWNIPKIDSKVVYKTSWTKNKFYFILLTKLELLNKHFLFQELMKNVACFLKETLLISLLKNSVICILVWFKLLLNHLLENV